MEFHRERYTDETSSRMTSCTFGTQPKAGAGDWAWFTWNAFLSWLVTHYSRLGSLVWLWHPDSLLNVSELCSSEITLPSFPSIVTWADAFNGNPAAALEVGTYLKTAYTAALWDTYCECSPNTGTSYDSAVLADSPTIYWKMEDSSSPLTDSSGHGENSAAVGGTFHVAGPWSGAFGWQPAGSYARLSSSNTHNVVPAAAEIWYQAVTAPASGQTDPVLSMDTSGSGGYDVYVDHAGKVCGISQSRGVWTCTTTPVLPFDGKWHYIGVTMDSSLQTVIIVDCNAYGIGTSQAINQTITVGSNSYTTNPRSRYAFWNSALPQANLIAHCNSGGGAAPPYTPPAPSDPTDIPDNPFPTCSTTADLCTEIQKVVAAVTNNFQAVNWLQSATAPTCWSPGTASTGLTGTGTLAVSDIVGVFVDITVPTRWGRTAETPVRYIPEIGSIQFETDSAPTIRYGLHYAQENILEAIPSTNSIRYNLRNGITANITPLHRCK